MGVADSLTKEQEPGVVCVLSMAQIRLSFVVEHLDPELGPWSALEYKTIAQESHHAGCSFILSCVPESLISSEKLKELQYAEIESAGVEQLFANKKSKVCLLDPAAKQELTPNDGGLFDVFLFGGILGMSTISSIGQVADQRGGDDPPRGTNVGKKVLLVG